MPLVLASLVVVMVAVGSARGMWTPNLHNGLLAVSFTFVGAYVLYQRPGHREGVLFMAAGVVEALMFLGRQIGHTSAAESSRWWGWVGVWPLPIALALCTFAVICFPDGRLPTPRWRVVALAVVVLAGLCATLSGLWPVDYRSAGVLTPHPINPTTPDPVETWWSAIAHPTFAAFQILWVVVVIVRWRSADGVARRQLTWMVGAAAISVGALLVGLAVWGTPRPGLISATLLPVAAGWAIVHGHHVASYSALTWMSRTAPDSDDLPADLARAVGESMGASSATLWMGAANELYAVGAWPDPTDDLTATTLDVLRRTNGVEVRAVLRQEAVVGALSIHRGESLSVRETRLVDDLVAQAALVLQHLSLSEVISRERRAGHLEGLSPRERDVLELMARGLSNAAICEELHLSIKTVEPAVSTIFTKLELLPDAGSNRRVLAVLAFVQRS